MDKRIEEPVKQVVGFQVEGRPASPLPISALQEAATMGEGTTTTTSAGSPSLVMIPTSFAGAGEEVPQVLVPVQPPTPSLAAQDAPVPLVDGLQVTAAAVAEDHPAGATLASVPAGEEPSTESSQTAENPVKKAEPEGEAESDSKPNPASSASNVPEGQPDQSLSAATDATDSSAPVVDTKTETAEKATKAERKAEKAAKSQKGPPENIEQKPKLSKAERRALQEQQRAAKAAAKTDAPKPQAKVTDQKSSAKVVEKERPAAQSKVQKAEEGAEATEPRTCRNQVELFSHLQQFQKTNIAGMLSRDTSQVHPAIVDLGLQYAKRHITGSNARCVAMLQALKQFVQDYRTPKGKLLARDLTARLNKQIDFLAECRPLALSMGNAIKHLKMLLTRLDPSVPEDEAKLSVTEAIDTFIQEKIVYADQALVSQAVMKINDGDVILTYAYSHVVADTLLEAQALGRKFQVVVADARPHQEGRVLLSKLLKAGLVCSYVDLNSVSSAMSKVDKVFLGASAVLSNGVVMSRVGSAAVAMVASVLNVPVLICCETYKFNERVQLDSITSNELGDPSALTQALHGQESSYLSSYASHASLRLLNLTYDAMPAEYVTMIVTEVGMVPPSSVPVILREYVKDSKAAALT